MNCNQLATPVKNPQATLQNNPFDVVRKTLEDPVVLKAIRKSARTAVGARRLPTIQVGTKSLPLAPDDAFDNLIWLHFDTHIWPHLH